MKSHLISSLINSLSKYPASSTVANPYATRHLRDNLDAYLSTLCMTRYSGHLLVGEAPGYRGCALTGIPFTSERVLRSASHAFLVELFPNLTIGGNVTERTATCVWKRVCTRRRLPAFWNIFPFHPHVSGNKKTNRRPTAVEIAAGRTFLSLVVHILAPHTVVAVGKVASTITRLAFPDLQHATLRHPSFGGSSEFNHGFDQLNIP